jgi:hypothetical protein
MKARVLQVFSTSLSKNCLLASLSKNCLLASLFKKGLSENAIVGVIKWLNACAQEACL